MQQRWVDAGHRPQRVPTLSDAAALGPRQALCSPATACADAKRCRMQQRWVDAGHRVHRPQRVPTLSDAAAMGRRRASCCPSCADARHRVRRPQRVPTLSDAAALGRRRAPCSPATACADARHRGDGQHGRGRRRHDVLPPQGGEWRAGVGTHGQPGIVFAGHSVCRR